MDCILCLLGGACTLSWVTLWRVELWSNTNMFDKFIMMTILLLLMITSIGVADTCRLTHYNSMCSSDAIHLSYWVDWIGLRVGHRSVVVLECVVSASTVSFAMHIGRNMLSIRVVMDNLVALNMGCSMFMQVLLPCNKVLVAGYRRV